MTEPLRIGILGAARIADNGIVAPARILGHRLVGVAARDRARAEEFAAERGVERVHDGYAELIADPEVEVVYNALVNSLHAEWNIAALRAGKHVLSEKPLTSNATQARAVQAAAAAAEGWIVEGFHYLHHPVNQRLREVVVSGELGEIESVDLVLIIPSPPEEDPRWSLELSGGATMDLGCYVLDAARHSGDWLGIRPRIVSVDATLKGPDLDAAMRADLAFDERLTGRCRWDMNAAERRMTWTISGSRGTASSPAFAMPHEDNRLIVTRGDVTREETVGEATSYTYQLARFAEVVRAGRPFPHDIDGSTVTADLIDDCYRRAGLRPRGLRDHHSPAR